jgi:hypothetical protein
MVWAGAWLGAALGAGAIKELVPSALIG